jgi:flavin-dependent dehydrogenase
VSRLIELLIKVEADQTPDFLHHRATLDFRAAASGLQGYIWDFPALLAGEAHLNVGVFDSRINCTARAELPAMLQKHVRARGFNPATSSIMAHPERWFHEMDDCARPNVLLTGDAAGVEPWLGEGISMALAYGPLAATAIRHAFETGDFSLQNYRQLILEDKLGRILRRNRRIARYFHRRRSQLVTHALVTLGKMYLSRKYGPTGMHIQ